MQFMKVYARSICQVRETLVDIFQEYPDEVEYIFKPSCVPLMRCAGCCNDESQECAPLEWYNITMQIMRIKPHISQLIMDMSFQQHSHCECRPKKDVKGKQENPRKGMQAGATSALIPGPLDPSLVPCQAASREGGTQAFNHVTASGTCNGK
ncbi:vascular endothelial growth factor A, long form isoform X5 [Ascaphus truei]|uniref:vascular endothelial growth factor A, long form isoform X5 n=1 Tax=Ascaphus truei TaxID=8439 RepID=UPI003F5ADB4B